MQKKPQSHQEELCWVGVQAAHHCLDALRAVGKILWGGLDEQQVIQYSNVAVLLIFLNRALDDLVRDHTLAASFTAHCLDHSARENFPVFSLTLLLLGSSRDLAGFGAYLTARFPRPAPLALGAALRFAEGAETGVSLSASLVS